MKLKDNILKEIKKDYNLRREIMNLRTVSEFTVLKWIRENDEQFLHFPTLELISNSLEIPIEEMIQREKLEIQTQ